MSHELYVCYGFVFVLFFSKLFYTIVECLMSFVLFFFSSNLQSCNLTGLLVFLEEHNMFFSSHWAKKKKKFTESKVIYLFISLLVSKRDRLVFVDGLRENVVVIIQRASFCECKHILGHVCWWDVPDFLGNARSFVKLGLPLLNISIFVKWYAVIYKNSTIHSFKPASLADGVINRQCNVCSMNIKCITLFVDK